MDGGDKIQLAFIQLQGFRFTVVIQPAFVQGSFCCYKHYWKQQTTYGYSYSAKMGSELHT